MVRMFDRADVPVYTIQKLILLSGLSYDGIDVYL